MIQVVALLWAIWKLYIEDKYNFPKSIGKDVLYSLILELLIY
jgi:hypothetical protein